MPKYTITYPEDLREMCIQNNWFTCGTTEQYERLFYANQNGFTVDQISIIIWICSQTDDRQGIINELVKAKAKYERELAEGQDAWPP